MKRSDQALLLVVGAFAVFVGVMVKRRSHPPRETRGSAPVNVGADQRDTRASPPAAPRPEDDSRRDLRVSSSNRAAQRDDAGIKARIAEATDTYMPDMLADTHGFLSRWPDRRQQGLRVWVQGITTVPDWDQRYAQMARDAFDDWRDGLPLRLDFVYDSASSDIRVVWTNQFPPQMGRRVGSTTRSVDGYGYLTSAEIVVAIHDGAGKTIPPADLAGIMRHEAGHALGLAHSRDPKTKMYPVEMVTDVQPADRATIRLLYSLPPGRVRP